MKDFDKKYEIIKIIGKKGAYINIYLIIDKKFILTMF